MSTTPFLDEFKQDIRKGCQRARGKFLDFLGTDGAEACILGVRPYGILFADVVREWLLDDLGAVLEMSLVDREGEILLEIGLEDKKLILIDDDVISGNTFWRITKLVRSRGPAEILFVSWEDHQDFLADVVLSRESPVRICERLISLEKASDVFHIPYGTLKWWHNQRYLSTREHPLHQTKTGSSKLLVSEDQVRRLNETRVARKSIPELKDVMGHTDL